MILRRPSYDIIGTAPLELRTTEGMILPVEVRLGRPYAEEGHWACPVEIVGLAPRPVDARGETAIQAVAIALGQARSTLQAALDQGQSLCQPGSPEVISSEWLQILFNACGDPSVGELVRAIFEDPEQLAASRAKHLAAESLHELERLLPNGFHDAKLRSFRLDLQRRRLAIELDVWVDDPAEASFQERYRRALLELVVAGQFAVEAQDPRYPFQEARPVRVDLSIERDASESSPERARFFVNEWNSFITVEDRGALLTWLDFPRRGDDPHFDGDEPPGL
jgi:hypothetical protein